MKDDYANRLTLENKMIEVIKEKWNCNFIGTGHTLGTRASYAPIDGFIVVDDIIKGVVENRCRIGTYADVKKWGGIFINYDKIIKGVDIGKMFGVPFIFIAYFFDEQKMYYWKITDAEGNLKTKIKLKSQLAQKNLQQGKEVKKLRNVALLNDADKFEIKM